MTTRARRKVIEREAKARLGWLIAPVMAIDKRPRVFLRTPTTTAARLADKMSERSQQRLTEVGDEGFAEDILGCWLRDDEMKTALAGFDASIEKRREQLSRRYLGTEILSLLDAAHASVKNAPLALLRDPSNGLRGLAAYGKLLASRRCRGEGRARALWDALGDIYETIYLPYLKSIWDIDALRRSQPPGVFPKPGQVVHLLSQRLESSALVHPLAVRVRNAVQHACADYVLEQNAIALWNALDGRETWRKQFSISELEGLAHELVAAATTLDQAVSYFNQRAAHEAGIFALCIDLRLAFKARDQNAVERIGVEMEARSRGMFTEIHALRAFGRV